MKYFLDTEFIEGFHNVYGRKRHHVDLISIGIVAEDGREYHAISSEYDSNEASPWVKENVLLPLYTKTVSGDARNRVDSHNFHVHFGKPLDSIKKDLLFFFGYGMVTTPDKDPLVQIHDKNIQIYADFADYDWVVFCSIFGTMMDLPRGMPMFCMDLKQMMEERGLTKEWKRENFPDDGAHDAIEDARWNKRLHDVIVTIPSK